MPTSLENYSPAETYDEALQRAATAWGVQPEYWDIWGQRHSAGPELQKTVLSSMGFQTGSTEELNTAIRRRQELEWGVPAPATLVLSRSAGVIPVNIPE